MGNVVIEWKKRRDGNERGPKEYLKELIGEEKKWNVSKARFDQMPSDKKSELLDAFNDRTIMDHHTNGATWIAYNEDDESVLEATASKVKSVIASCPDV